MATVLALCMVAACAASQQTREVQYAKIIKQVDADSATALDMGIIDADVGEVVLASRDVAERELRRAVKARRSGQTREVWDQIIDLVLDALAEAAAYIEGRKAIPPKEVPE
jgi:hypothetical protein